MGTACFPCGCSITTDMFNGSIVSVHLCAKHSETEEGQKLLQAMADYIIDLPDKNDLPPESDWETPSTIGIATVDHATDEVSEP